jgi:hypothetical protein
MIVRGRKNGINFLLLKKILRAYSTMSQLAYMILSQLAYMMLALGQEE